MRLPKRSNSSARSSCSSLPHLGADGRLRTVARLRGFGKTLQPDDFEKRVELVEIHIPAPSGARETGPAAGYPVDS